jgi:hypothetical protein
LDWGCDEYYLVLCLGLAIHLCYWFANWVLFKLMTFVWASLYYFHLLIGACH